LAVPITSMPPHNNRIVCHIKKGFAARSSGLAPKWWTKQWKQW